MLTALFIALGILTVGYLAVWVTEVRRHPGSFKAPSLIEYGIGLVTNFFDALGIGSFATTTALFRLFGVVRDEQLPGLQQLAEAPERWVQADVVVDLDQLVLRQPKGLAMLGVALVGEGDHRVDAIVAAVELQDDQDASVFLRAGVARRAREECGQRRRQGNQRRIPQAAGE